MALSFAVRPYGTRSVLSGLLVAMVCGVVSAAEVSPASLEEALPGYLASIGDLAGYQARTHTGPFHVGPLAGYVSPAGGPVALPSAVPAEYGEKGTRPDPFEVSRRVPDPGTIDLSGRDLTDRRCLSIGAANRGRLVNGIPMHPYPGFLVRPTVHHVYGTPETIAALHYAVARVHQRFPGAHDLVVGDLSRRRGGRLPPHLSHQSGRDVDIGYYHRNIDAPRSFVDANASNLDVERTWAFVEALLEDHKVEYIFMDYAVQRLLYKYVKYTLGAPESYLEMVFSYPRRTRTSFIRHVSGHRDHIHVRFWSPIAVAASRGVALAPANGRWFTPEEVRAYTRGGYVALDHLERVDWGGEGGTTGGGRLLYATYRVRPGDTLSGIAKRHHVSTTALMAVNGLNGKSIIRPGQRLQLPMTRPARQGEVPSLATASRSGRESSRKSRADSANPGLSDAGTRGRRLVRSSMVYRVESGDCPGRIARRFDVPVDTLLEVNGLTRTSRIYPGQRLLIPDSRTWAGEGVAAGDRVASSNASGGESGGASSSAGTYRLVRRESWVTVAPGDSLWLIARRHGTTVGRLCRLNGLRRDAVLQIGQKLKAAEWYDRVPVEPRPVLTSQPQPEAPAGG